MASTVSPPSLAELPMFARNVVHFVRLLRAAGLPMSPALAIDALDALRLVEIERRDDVHDALAAILVHSADERALFDSAFDLFWHDPDWQGKLRALLLPKAKTSMPPPVRNNRLADALATRASESVKRDVSEANRRELHAHATFSADERLRHRDFDTLRADEWRALRHAIRNRRIAFATEPTRRLRAASHGIHADVRASARQAVHAGGDWLVWKYRVVRERKPPLVLLLDISGSMANYSRAVLYYCHALLQSRERLQVFLFGTRLTHATRILRERDPDAAIAALSQRVEDWAGGTRIGAALAEFNRRWAKRALAGRTTVLLVTDGLDHEAIDLLDAEMARLARNAHRVVWLNPLLRYARFSAHARGVRAILPHVDAHRAVHNLESLDALAHDFAHLARAPRHPMPVSPIEGAPQWN